LKDENGNAIDPTVMEGFNRFNADGELAYSKGNSTT
jgi:hypothetical protein